MKRLIATILLPALVVGCGGGNSGNGGITPNAQLTGSWHATLTSAASQPVSPLDIFILQNGAALSSDTNRVAVNTCSNELTMSGSVSSNNINMVVTGNLGDTVTISGTASGRTSFSGRYTIKTSGCIPDDRGTLSATLVPSVQSDSWTGTTVSTRYLPDHSTFTASLTEDASGNITGTFTLTGFCLTTLPVQGAQTGNIMSLGDTVGAKTGLGGTIDAMAKNITGRYDSSACAGDNGDLTMSRP